MTNNSTEIILQIQNIASFISEDNYSIRINEARKLLIKLRDLGVKKEYVYQELFKKHNELPDCFSRDFMADILDYVSDWCSSHNRIWNDEQ